MSTTCKVMLLTNSSALGGGSCEDNHGKRSEVHVKEKGSEQALVDGTLGLLQTQTQGRGLGICFTEIVSYRWSDETEAKSKSEQCPASPFYPPSCSCARRGAKTLDYSRNNEKTFDTATTESRRFREIQTGYFLSLDATVHRITTV